MKITFILPYLNLTGGLRVVSVYAKLLADKGHTVTVVSPNKRESSLKEKIGALLLRKNIAIKKSNFDMSFFEDAPYQVKILDKFRPVMEKDIPDADIVIATFWNTAEWVSDYTKPKGKKHYFIQHYEVHPWMPIERVKATLRLPIKKIVVSQWIADVLKDEYDDPNAIVVANGVDHQKFFAPIRCKQNVPTIGMMYSQRSYKGCDAAFEAYRKAKETVSNLKLIAFGTQEPTSQFSLPEDTEYYLKPAQENLKDIYSKCDAWIFSSRSEGFGLPILEAMACRTPVVGTKAGAAPDLINQANGFLVEIDDVTAMANAIVDIAAMTQEKWQQLSKNAYEASLNHSWTESLNYFEQALND
jgi:glycosyltransferase involved in cell wall biosynthesis